VTSAGPSRTTSAWSKGADVDHPRQFSLSCKRAGNMLEGRARVVVADGGLISPLALVGCSPPRFLNAGHGGGNRPPGAAVPPPRSGAHAAGASHTVDRVVAALV